MFVCVCVCVYNSYTKYTANSNNRNFKKINKITWKKVIFLAIVQETLRVGKRDYKKCSRK